LPKLLKKSRSVFTLVVCEEDVVYAQPPEVAATAVDLLEACRGLGAETYNK